MSSDAFRRLALIAACSSWATLIALVWIHVHWLAGLAALLAGPTGGFVLSLEPAPDSPEQARRKVRERLPGASRRDIEARARLHRDDDGGEA